MKKIISIFAMIFMILAIGVGVSAAVNNPPTVPSTPVGPSSGISGTQYGFSTMSSDPDGNSVRYTYDWGDGTTATSPVLNSGITNKMFHKWTVVTPTTFRVMVKAADYPGGLVSAWSGTTSIAVSVGTNNPPATPSVPSGSISGSSGTSYSYSTKATDPDGNNVKYSFDWGDGTFSVTALVASGTTSSASHVWTVAAGTTKTFSVSAKATDELGAVSGPSIILTVTVTGPVLVNHPPATPAVPVGPVTGDSGTSYSYSAKTTDPDGNKIKYTFDWGDGTTSVTALIASGTMVSTSHTWTVASGTTKSFSVSVKATDESGLVSSSSSFLSVVVAGPVLVNHPPNTPTTPVGPITGTYAGEYSYSTSATDPDGDQVKYVFDWGDGNSSETAYVASGTTASASHQWSVPEGKSIVFNVTAQAIDDTGIASS